MNENHAPAGSSEGGQFVSGAGGGAGETNVNVTMPKDADVSRELFDEKHVDGREVYMSKETAAALTKLGVKHEDLMGLASVPHGAEANVLATINHRDQLVLAMGGRDGETHFYSERIYDFEEMAVENDSSGVTSGGGHGFGTSMLVSQVGMAERYGFKDIETLAAGHGSGAATKPASLNGYYTWARMGFDGRIKEDHPSFGGAKYVSELMKTASGRDAWLKYGTATRMTFDMRRGSTSMKVLDAYAREKGVKK